jgi:NTE family protein
MPRRLLVSLLLLLIIGSLGARKIGYALSGGGARGFAHIGILKVLEEVGIKPDYISGTSMGALVGGLYAMGYKATQIESLFVNTDWDEFLNDDWNRDELYIGQKRWAPYGNAFFRIDNSWKPQLPQSVIIGNRINLELFRMFASASEVSNFKDLPIPFTCIATDLVDGELKVFDHGSLMQGIRASMSIPSILQPFPSNNTLYIDGGISQNLPGKQTKDMGADFVIGFKVNTGLKQQDSLTGIIQVLDQTINIGITNNLNEQLAYCDYILEPDLSGFSATKFNDVKKIITAGENYAREHLKEITALANKSEPDSLSVEAFKLLLRPQIFHINKISVVGGNHIHPTKIREYAGLAPDKTYSDNEIINGMKQAWNSQLFDIIYPVLEKKDDGYLLEIYVQERERKYLAANLTYDREDEFSAGAVLSLHNLILKNSRLIAELKLGGINELNFDFVKNFGDSYGIYYRMFPYTEEKRIYFYQNHNKVTSARSLELGVTSGIGLFAGKLFVVEGYGFTYHTNLYREIAISDTLEKSINVSGIGIKAYHESLDDYVFPRSGVKAIAKSSFASDDILSDVTANRFRLEGIAYKIISLKLSGLAGMHIGSHFKSKSNAGFDPYYLGGLDNFAGYGYYEKSAPYFRLLQVGLVAVPVENLFITAKLQFLTYSNTDNWFSNNISMTCGVLEVGFKNYLIPVKIAAALAGDGEAKYYLSIGYTGDIFHFSRR